MAESLKGKVAVITGVGSGFAKATAELFARLDQVSLVLIDLNEAGLKATAEACQAAGSRVVAVVGDVTKPETFQRALRETLENFGKVDFLDQLCRRRAQGGAHRGDGRRDQPAHHRPEPDQHDHELPDLHAAVQEAGLRQDHQRFQRMRPPFVAGLVGLFRRQGRRQRVHQVPVHRAAAARHRRHAARAGRVQHRLPGGGRRASTSSSGTRSWPCGPSTSPTWCTRPAPSPRVAASPRCWSTGWRRTSAGSRRERRPE